MKETGDNDELLKEEYFKLQDQYEDYDKRALTIKSWISAGAVTAIAIDLNQANQPTLTLIVVIMFALCFWYLEAHWKLFQYGISDRIRVIEAYFRRDPDIYEKEPAPLQIYNWWFKSYSEDSPIYPYEEKYRPKSKLRRLWWSGRQSFVHLPYSLIIIICFFLQLYRYDYVKIFIGRVWG